MCGRPLWIAAAYAGQPVTCCHCRGRFVGTPPAMHGHRQAAQVDSLLCRADQLLAVVTRSFGKCG